MSINAHFSRGKIHRFYNQKNEKLRHKEIMVESKHLDTDVSVVGSLQPTSVIESAINSDLKSPKLLDRATTPP